MGSKLILHYEERTLQIGDIKSAKDLGFRDSHNLRWEECPLCHVPRWVRLDSKSRFCQACNYRSPKRGITHPLWKGGQTIQRGYIVVYSPSHPHADINGYIKRCRLTLESQLGRILPRKIHIHHINGIKTDDRPSNLIAISHAEHIRLHGLERGGLQKEKHNA